MKIETPHQEKSLDFTFWFSISPELEQRTQEVIHKKYGGREKAEKAARIIQESYRQYRGKDIGGEPSARNRKYDSERTDQIIQFKARSTRSAQEHAPL